jgi:acyl carrier protein
MSSFSSKEIRDYLTHRFSTQFQALGFNPEEVRDDFDLLREGIIDSLGIMELVADIETHFGYAIDFSDLDAEQTTILGPLAAYIQRRLLEMGASDSSDGNRLRGPLPSSPPRNDQ